MNNYVIIPRMIPEMWGPTVYQAVDGESSKPIHTERPTGAEGM